MVVADGEQVYLVEEVDAERALSAVTVCRKCGDQYETTFRYGVIGHHVYAVNADDPTTEIDALKHEITALRQLLTERDARIAELEPSRDEWERAWYALRQDSLQQLESQSITYQDNLTEIQMLKAALEHIYTIVHEGYGTGNDRCEVIIQNALAPPHAPLPDASVRSTCTIYPGLTLLRNDDGEWLEFDGGGEGGKKGAVHLRNHFENEPTVGPAVLAWLERMQRWENGA
jgi:hypothetical protein